MAPLTFNKENLAAIGNTDSDTGLALLLIFVNAVVSGIVSGISDSGFGAGFAQSDASFAQLFIIGFLFQLVLYLIFSWIQGFVLRGFGGQASTASCLRILGFASVWGIIGSIIGFVAPSLGGYIGLIAFLCFAFGLSAFSGVGIVTAIIAVIVAAIIAAIILVIVMLILIVALIVAIFG